MAIRLERGEYLFEFEPTINKAIAFADKKPSDPYHATPEEIKQLEGCIFQSGKLMTDRQLRRLRYKLNNP